MSLARALAALRRMSTKQIHGEGTAALLRELDGLIDGDRYFMSPRVKTLKAIRAKIRPEPVREPSPPPPKPYAPPRATARQRGAEALGRYGACQGKAPQPDGRGATACRSWRILNLRSRQHLASNFCGSILNRESPNAQLAVFASPDH
jgi:hypothetical protein